MNIPAPSASSVTLNGRSHPFSCPAPLPALLESLGLIGKPVVIELNGTPILPKHHATTQIHSNDQIEIVTLAAGG